MEEPITLLAKYTMLAKDIIYDGQRLEKLLPMMGSPQGAIVAVKTVLGAIEQAKEIPPDLVRNLAVNTYMVLVDMAQAASEEEAKATGEAPAKVSSQKLLKVIGMLLKETDLTHGAGAQQGGQPGAQPPQGQPPAPPQAGGILAQGAM